MDELSKVRIAGDIVEKLYETGLKKSDIFDIAEYLKKHAQVSIGFDGCEFPGSLREVNLLN